MAAIRYEEEYIYNERGMKLFTCRWIPLNTKPKALVFICHGTGTRLANEGYAVYGIDYESHGKSAGLQGYISSFENLLHDCDDYFINICEQKENKGKLRFLYGESMGGAVAIYLHRKKPSYWDGAIHISPMCKIADNLRPSRFVVGALTVLCHITPTLKAIPFNDFIDNGIKNPEYRNEVRNNPYCYKGRPRLKTAYNVVNASIDIEKNLDKVSLPFIVLHGAEDKIIDPSGSQTLYESAKSKDKTFKLYPGMWHAITTGEPSEDIDLVFKDIIEWLNKRTVDSDSDSIEVSESGDKNMHDNVSEGYDKNMHDKVSEGDDDENALLQL